MKKHINTQYNIIKKTKNHPQTTAALHKHEQAKYGSETISHAKERDKH